MNVSLGCWRGRPSAACWVNNAQNTEDRLAEPTSTSPSPRGRRSGVQDVPASFCALCAYKRSIVTRFITSLEVAALTAPSSSLSLLPLSPVRCISTNSSSSTPSKTSWLQERSRRHMRSTMPPLPTITTFWRSGDKRAVGARGQPWTQEGGTSAECGGANRGSRYP